MGKHCASLQDEVLSFVTIWRDLEDIVLGAISQTSRYIAGAHSQEASRKGDLSGVKNGTVIIRDSGWREREEKEGEGNRLLSRCQVAVG